MTQRSVKAADATLKPSEGKMNGRANLWIYAPGSSAPGLSRERQRCIKPRAVAGALQQEGLSQRRQ